MELSDHAHKRRIVRRRSSVQSGFVQCRISAEMPLGQGTLTLMATSCSSAANRPRVLYDGARDMERASSASNAMVKILYKVRRLRGHCSASVAPLDNLAITVAQSNITPQALFSSVFHVTLVT
ncbi:hypothetical protein DL546_007782 [Coniochaeta pulveracea]|uniref:Uncharacterized protein n=1 Tax=Coniochaeta pulveracea TaxID=177199 RepID=A0A420YGK4_9PEZI|nr:hypothetical protein DL546_007782 [Coniochaeta pulveracea]